MGTGLDLYRQATAVNWTYISPAADFDAEGQKSGAYTLAGEVFQVNAQGESYISYADYAVALVDIAEKVATSRNEFPYLHKKLNGLKDSSIEELSFYFYLHIV